MLQYKTDEITTKIISAILPLVKIDKMLEKIPFKVEKIDLKEFKKLQSNYFDREK
jgi:hypothetical protein